MSWRQGGAATIDGAVLDVLKHAQVQRLPAGSVDIEELAEEGAGKVTFLTDATSIRILHDNNNHPISWYFENKCADGAILLSVGGASHLHVIELKSKLTPDKWNSARRQIQGMLFNSLAVAGALSLSEPQLIKCYIAYNTETVSRFIRTNPAVQKQMVGTGAPALGLAAISYSDFAKSLLTLPDGQVVPIQLVTRDEHGNASVDLRI